MGLETENRRKYSIFFHSDARIGSGGMMRGLMLWRHRGQTIINDLEDCQLEWTWMDFAAEELLVCDHLFPDTTRSNTYMPWRARWEGSALTSTTRKCFCVIPLSTIPWGPIEADRFVGFWQPNFCLKSQNMCGFTQGTFSALQPANEYLWNDTNLIKFACL